MKKFLSGVLCATLVFSLALSALAISGRMTISVSPINIQVNGQTFAPTDVNGKEVPVFAYEGTTYAPLRALAEAYGLEVGYDAGANMATVQDPDILPNTTTKVDETRKPEGGDSDADEEEVYQKFASLWEIKLSEDMKHFDANCTNSNSLLNLIDDMSEADIWMMLAKHTKNIFDENIIQESHKSTGISGDYYYGDESLAGTSYNMVNQIINGVEYPALVFGSKSGMMSKLSN